MRYSFNLSNDKMARQKGDLGMNLKTMTVRKLARILEQCGKTTEINVVIGNIPQAIPIESLAIRQDIDGKEIITLVVNHQVFIGAINHSMDMLTKTQKAGDSYERIKDGGFR